MKFIHCLPILLVFLFIHQNALSQSIPEISDTNRVYNTKEVDSIPKFIGGNKALTAICAEKIRGRSGLKHGDFIAELIVEKDSSISKVESIVKGIFSSAQEKFLIDVINDIKKGWIPAQLNDKSVSCNIILSLSIVDTGVVVYLIRSRQKAEFKGGNQQLYAFIAKNIKVPIDSKTGSVVVSFVVEKNGTLSQVKVERTTGFVTESQKKAAINVVKSTSGLWNPAIQDDKLVRMRFSLPITFNMGPDKSKPKKKKRRR